MKNADDMAPTRQSLLGRLKNWQDQESWKAFFDTYWRLIYTAALRAGLTETEAQDVVQETVIAVSQKMPRSEYDASRGSFKAWLLRLTSWRIADHVRTRNRGGTWKPPETRIGTGTGTATASLTRKPSLEQIADPASLDFESVWEEEWEKNLLEAAIDRVKSQVDAKQFQIFDCCVLKEWPISRTAEAFQINAARVYLAKHRVSRLVKREVANLRTQPI